MSPSTPTLRRATPDDAPFFAALAVDRFAHDPAVSFLPPQLRAMQAKAWDASLAGQVDAGAEDFVVELDGAPVGRFVRHLSGDVVRLVELTISFDRRGAGIGGAVLLQFRDELARSGIRSTLAVQRSNPARALYQRLGFVDTGRTDLSIEMTYDPPRSVPRAVARATNPDAAHAG